jgi:hypothetical protein
MTMAARVVNQGPTIAGRDEWPRSRWWWWRWGYTAKALWCCLTDRYHDTMSIDRQYGRHEHVLVAMFDYHESHTIDGVMRSWAEVQVAVGRRNWHLHVDTSGD